MKKFKFSEVDKYGDTSELIEYLSKFESLPEVQLYRKQAHSLLELSTEDEVIEIGCGTGHNAFALSKNITNGTVVAVDNSKKMIDYADTKYGNQSQFLSFVYSSADNLPFQNDHFTKCYCERTLQHVRQPLKVLSEIKRVMKKNSYLLNIEPDWESLTITCDDIDLTRKIITHQCNYIVNPKIGKEMSDYIKKTNMRVVKDAINKITFDNIDLADFFYNLNLSANRAVADKIITISEKDNWINNLRLKTKNNQFSCSLNLISTLSQKCV